MQWYSQSVSLRLIAKSWQGRHNTVRGLLRSALVPCRIVESSGMLCCAQGVLSSLTGNSGFIQKGQ